MNALPQFGAQTPARDPQALAREILAQSRFRGHTQAPASHTWWDTVRDWFGDRWNQLLDAFAHHVRVGPGAGAAIGDVLLVIVIALVVVVVVRLLLGMARENASAEGAAHPLSVRANPTALHAAAQQAAQLGGYAAAIALLFRAALATLDARGLLRDDPSRTVNECRRDVRARAMPLSPSFERIARAFTAAVYAEDRVTAEHWDDAERAYGEIAMVQSSAA